MKISRMIRLANDVFGKNDIWLANAQFVKRWLAIDTKVYFYKLYLHLRKNRLPKVGQLNYYYRSYSSFRLK